MKRYTHLDKRIALFSPEFCDMQLMRQRIRGRTRRNRKMPGIRIKPKEGLWISYHLKLKGLNCRLFAARLGVGEATVSSILNGHRKSARIEEALYQTLGYPSFEAMIAAARGKEAKA